MEKTILTAQTEKPNHYTYLKEFRVEQCPSFLQHKCNQHRPFICFNWHFMNQRRRRPVRRRDGSFNYSADNYCTKYDETTGICPDGDDCPFLHRTAGDTERRYHLRYYKTCMCVHDTDSRGYCVKNGHHCAFAHGVHDQRPPVYDIKELEALQASEVNAEGTNGPNVLDKERNLMNEDPKWQDTNYVLANYKTEPCKRPPRLCRQGYACPQYHNSKDKRRSPRKYKYRSTPCPNVKHGEEWGEPTNCEAGDNCQYCHTRTEQQFHPEIYKSTKCNDVQQAGYCPRSVFCAFAHVEPYVLAEDLSGRDLDGSNPLGLSDMMSGVLPPEAIKKDKLNDLNNFSFNQFMQNGSAESSESASTSSLGSNNSNHNRAPGSQLHQKHNSNSLTNNNHISIHQSSSISNNTTNSIVSNPFPHFSSSDLAKQFLAMSTLDGVGYGLDSSLGVGLGSSNLMRNPSAPVRIPGSPMSSLLENTSAPVDIPGSSLSNFSPSHSNLFPVGDHFGHVGSGSHPGGSVPKINNSFGHTADFLYTSSHLMSPGLVDGGLSISPDLRLPPDLNSMNNDLSNNSSNRLFDNHLQQSKHPFSMSPLVNPGISEIGRLRDELANKNQQMINWEDQLTQANKACDAWKKEMEDSNRKAVIAEQQRDEALGHVKSLKDKLDQISIAGTTSIKASELKGMPLHKLKNLQAKLRAEIEEVEKVLYLETATKCMTCEENNRTVTLVPCNHYVLCDSCAATQRECPYCQTPVTSQA